MQNVIIEKPYEFIRARRNRVWTTFLYRRLPLYLNKAYGLASIECRGTNLLRRSIADGCGVVLAPNHCRPCDPMVLGAPALEAGSLFFVMASWHLFMQSAVMRRLLPMLGCFSLYREGMDREAMRESIEIVAAAERPLVLFPEGIVSRSNDRLNPFMDGPAFIARTAARRRAPGRVVVHPVALRYFFMGDLWRAIEPVIEQIERRFSWNFGRTLPWVDRIRRIGEGMLALKEIEHFGRAQAGGTRERQAALIERLLSPLEDEWLDGRREPDLVGRIKRLRSAILPDMIGGGVSEAEHDRRWRQLADVYLAQQVISYPPDYIRSRPTPERVLETVERFEEDLTDNARIHRPLRVVVEIGEAIEVGTERARGPGGDPLMQTVRTRLESMLERLGSESPVLEMSGLRPEIRKS